MACFVPSHFPFRFSSRSVTRASISEYTEPHFGLSSVAPHRLLFSLYTRIQPSQTDYSGSLHHSQYIPILERARVEYLAALGLKYSDLVSRANTELVVVDLQIRYRQAAKMGDLVQVGTILMEGKSPVRLSVAGWFKMNNRILATSKVDVACVDAKTGKLKKRPQMIVDMFEKMEWKKEELMGGRTVKGNGKMSWSMEHDAFLEN